MPRNYVSYLVMAVAMLGFATLSVARLEMCLRCRRLMAGAAAAA